MRAVPASAGSSRSSVPHPPVAGNRVFLSASSGQSGTSKLKCKTGGSWGCLLRRPTASPVAVKVPCGSPASSPKPCWPRLRRALEARGNHIAPLSTPNPEGALSLRPLVAPRSLSPGCMEAEVPVTGSSPGTTHQETGSEAVQHRGMRALAAEDAGVAGRRA